MNAKHFVGLNDHHQFVYANKQYIDDKSTKYIHLEMNKIFR